ncbi:MAG: hypothetical protein AAFO69_10420 [Bacteroidota bacterium]
MTAEEVKDAIAGVPIGSKLQIIKRNGSILEAVLMSYEVTGIEAKDYGELVVPALPPALIVRGGPRFGNFRVDVEEIIKIAWVG